ncbi:MAG TPA: RNA 2',3'-cyclic phosphodiesterase [Steroidobacteraceae bacterium]|nr:RNA 2',3'-cyclic phosphodiesterase [Steroidobacteraceae bacterium]
MRLFFALWPDVDTQAQIANAAAALRLAGDAQRVPRENYHVTLAFVGEVAASRLAVLQQIGRGQRAAGCTITFNAYDYWPRPQVAVAIARESPAALSLLWTQLHRDLALHQAALNVMCSRSPLRTHITLARKVAQAPVLQAMSPFHWNVRSFSLIRSDTSGARSVYTVVDTWQLLYE